MSIPKKSRTKGELIPVVIFEFHNWMNLWLHKGVYELEGGYKGCLKTFEIPIHEIKKVHHLLVNPKDYPTAEWEP